MTNEVASHEPTIVHSIQPSYDINDCWWAAFVANRIRDGVALAKRSEEDLALGPDPLVPIRKAVESAVPGATLLGSNRGERCLDAIFACAEGTTIAVEGTFQSARVSVWSRDHAGADRICAAIAAALPRTKPAEDGSVPFTFWHCRAEAAEAELDIKSIACPELSASFLVLRPGTPVSAAPATPLRCAGSALHTELALAR